MGDKLPKIPLTDFEQLNHHLKNITERIDLLSKPKADKVSLAAVIVSILALLFTAIFSYKTAQDQSETQAYNYWQNYLALAVKNPELANGYDSTICGKSVVELSRPHYMDSLNADTAAHEQYVKYAWFVAGALAAAESVCQAKPNDRLWDSTVVDALKGHATILQDKYFYDSADYVPAFTELVHEAIKKKKAGR